jgi:Mg2+-importing ATPase
MTAQPHAQLKCGLQLWEAVPLQQCKQQPLLASAAARQLLRAVCCNRMQAALFGISVAVGLTPEMLPMVVNANLARGAGEGREVSAGCSATQRQLAASDAPPLLPALRTAVAMAQQRTIVKRLDAVQNLGAMDICCTDKTGTLTRDEVQLLRWCLRACRGCLRRLHRSTGCGSNCRCRCRLAAQVVLTRWLDWRGRACEDALRFGFLNSYFQTGLPNLLDAAILQSGEAACRHSRKAYLR